MPKKFSDEEKLEIKKSILKETAEIMHKKGFKKTTLNQIISNCNIGKGTFYQYFQSKEEIVDEIFIDFKNNLEQDNDLFFKNGANKEDLRIMLKSYIVNEGYFSLLLSFKEEEVIHYRTMFCENPLTLSDDSLFIDRVIELQGISKYLSMNIINSYVMSLVYLLYKKYDDMNPQQKNSMSHILDSFINNMLEYIYN